LTPDAPTRQTVLIVEDEPLLLLYVVELLEDAGFTVLEASNADEAILILEARTDIRVVFTDIEMPGSMDGLKLARAIRGRWPPIELVVTSGRFKPTAGETPDRSHFLPKPYDGSRLVETIRKLAA
jgi:CheY-like chemotaxis protein